MHARSRAECARAMHLSRRSHASRAHAPVGVELSPMYHIVPPAGRHAGRPCAAAQRPPWPPSTPDLSHILQSRGAEQSIYSHASPFPISLFSFQFFGEFGYFLNFPGKFRVFTFHFTIRCLGQTALFKVLILKNSRICLKIKLIFELFFSKSDNISLISDIFLTICMFL